MNEKLKLSNKETECNQLLGLETARAIYLMLQFINLIDLCKYALVVYSMPETATTPFCCLVPRLNR